MSIILALFSQYLDTGKMKSHLDRSNKITRAGTPMVTAASETSESRRISALSQACPFPQEN